MTSEDWFPLSEDEHSAQLAGLGGLLGAGARVLDLGAGDGRIAVPLAEAGHRVVAIDSDPEACTLLAGSGAGIEVLEQDFLGRNWAPPDGVFDCVLCLGHTFMQAHEIGAAVDLLGTLRASVRAGGVFVIDDIPGSLWPEIAEGNWQEGVSEDGGSQLIWAEDDNVFALRSGDDVDPGDWSVRESDARFRLWTLGELELLSRVSGWGTPRRMHESHLIALTGPED